jgi:hypothetical protein
MWMEIYHKIVRISYTSLRIDTMASKGEYCGLDMYLVWGIIKATNNFSGEATLDLDIWMTDRKWRITLKYVPCRSGIGLSYIASKSYVYTQMQGLSLG